MNRLKATAITLTALIVALSIAASTMAILDLQADSADLRAESTESSQELRDLRSVTAEQRAALEALAGQVESLGEEPVVEPSEVSSPGPRVPNSIRYVPIPGKDGEDGNDGDDGQDSTVPGPASTVPGPGPTTEQIAAALATYCAARNDCTPPAPRDGVDGKDGKDGEPGRGIASIGCTSGLTPQTYTVVYTDGTTQDFTCGELPPVEPTPEETP